MYIPSTAHALYSDITCLSRNRYTSFYSDVDMSSPAQYRLHAYLVVNLKRELLVFEMAVIVGLQDISSMYITLENPYVYMLYVYYLIFFREMLRIYK